LDLAPSETHSDQEVNLFAGPPNGGAEKPRIPLNRKRIYASTHTAPTTATSSASSSSVPSPAGGAAVRLRFPQTTSLPARTGTAALSPGSGFVSGFSASAGLSSASSAHAAHAHQAGAIAPPGAPPTASPPSSPVNRQGGSKSRPRFYAPPATTTTNTAVVTGSASSLSTERTTQWERDQSTSLPQPPAVYPVSSIFPSGGGSEMSGKRINYNYHPIIDFFEKNRKAEAAATVSSIAEESRIVEQRIFPQNSPKSQQNGMGLGMETITGVYQHPIPVPKTHERRMGYRAHNGGVGGAGAVGGGAGFASDNAWLPMVVE